MGIQTDASLQPRKPLVFALQPDQLRGFVVYVGEVVLVDLPHGGDELGREGALALAFPLSNLLIEKRRVAVYARKPPNCASVRATRMRRPFSFSTRLVARNSWSPMIL